MNRNTILGFTGGLVFAASLIIGLLVSDAATDQGGGEPRLPGALGEPVEIVPAVPIADPEADVGPADPDQVIQPSQAAYVPVDTDGGSGVGGGSRGGGSFGGGGGGTDGTTPGETTELTVAPLADDPFAPVEIDPRFDGLFTGDIFFDLLEFPPFRFIDFCAGDGALPGCPEGVGGTVLAPLGGGLDSLGDFRLGAHLGNADATGGICGAPAEGDRPLFIWANHPAEFEITYYPNPAPRLRRMVTVANTDPDHPEFLRFTEDAVEDRLSSSPWPRECFILTPSEGPWTQYLVEVNATSFTGASTSKTYTVDIREGPRPPVVINALDDNNARAFIPVKGLQAATLSVVHESDTTTCADLEASRTFGEIIPGTESGHLLDWGDQPAYEDASPSWPYDPAYDEQRVVNIIDLEEGTSYLVCIWWLESAERSFDDSVVVERERRWITTPNRLTAIVEARSVENFSGHDLDAGSYTVRFSCPSELREITIPPTDMIIRQYVAIPERPAVCDHGGREIQIPTTGSFTTPTGERGTFAMALDPASPRGFQRLSVDLSTDEEPGPTLVLSAWFLEGSDRGTDRWQVGAPTVFEPLPDVPGDPTEIQIDIFASGVEPDGRDGIRVTAEFDRPVRLSAFLLGDDLCLTGPEPGHTSGGFSQTHAFRLDGLCLRTRYSVALEVEDEDGLTAGFADIAPGLPQLPGARYFGGTGWTDGFHAAYTVWAAGGSQAAVEFFSVAINGRNFDMTERSGCLPATAESGPGAHTRAATDVWGEEVTINIGFRAKERDRSQSPGCIAFEDHRYDSWTASVSSTVTIAEFEAGAITIPLNPDGSRPSDGDLEVEVVIRGEITG